MLKEQQYLTVLITVLAFDVANGLWRCDLRFRENIVIVVVVVVVVVAAAVVVIVIDAKMLLIRLFWVANKRHLVPRFTVA